MSSNGESSSRAEGSSSDEASRSQPSQRRPHTASKWPSDKIVVTEISWMMGIQQTRRPFK
ncbi:hypothetical protein ACP4OV_014465 [Aristida adscensionis]